MEENTIDRTMLTTPLTPPLPQGDVSGSALDLDKEWKMFLTKVNPEKWSANEETCYYLAFCTGWWARTGEAAFQADS